MDTVPDDAGNLLPAQFAAATAGDASALAFIRTEAEGGRACALYLWAHLAPAEAWHWCSTRPVPPHPHALEMAGCLLHWGTVGPRNDVGALTQFWLAGKHTPSLASELERERLLELVPGLRAFPREADLSIPIGMNQKISRTVWMIRDHWRGEDEQ